MMARNSVGDQFGHFFVSALQAKLQHLLRTGGRMIDTTPSTPGDIILVGCRVFPEVMEPAGQRGSPCCAELAAQHLGSQRGLLEMISQGLPIGTVRTCR